MKCFEDTLILQILFYTANVILYGGDLTDMSAKIKSLVKALDVSADVFNRDANSSVRLDDIQQ